MEGDTLCPALVVQEPGGRVFIVAGEVGPYKQEKVILITTQEAVLAPASAPEGAQVVMRARLSETRMHCRILLESGSGRLLALLSTESAVAPRPGEAGGGKVSIYRVSPFSGAAGLLRDPTEGFFAVVERSSRPNVFVMHSAGPGPASRRRPLLFISAEGGGGLCMTEPGGTLARASDGGEDEDGRPR